MSPFMLTLVLLMTAGAGAPKPSLAIMELQAGNVDPSLPGALQDALAAEIRTTGVYGRVVTSRELGGLLKLEQTKQAMDCSDTGCMAELANALGVDHIITGSISRVDDAIILSVQLLDVRRAVTRKAVLRRVHSARQADILDEVPSVAAELLGRPVQGVSAGTRPAAEQNRAVESASRTGYWALAAAGGLFVPLMLVGALVLGVAAYLAAGGVAYFAANIRPGLRSDELGWLAGGLMGAAVALLGTVVGGGLAALGVVLALR